MHAVNAMQQMIEYINSGIQEEISNESVNDMVWTVE